MKTAVIIISIIGIVILAAALLLQLALTKASAGKVLGEVTYLGKGKIPKTIQVTIQYRIKGKTRQCVSLPILEKHKKERSVGTRSMWRIIAVKRGNYRNYLAQPINGNAKVEEQKQRRSRLFKISGIVFFFCVLLIAIFIM